MTEDSPLAIRRKTFYVIIGSIALLFAVRLVQLQLLSEARYGKKAEENSIRAVVRQPIRGYIFDRNKELIVDNRAAYTVTVTPSEFKEHALPLLASILQMDTTIIKDRIQRGRQYSLFAPARIKRDINFRTLALIEEHHDRLPGVAYQVEIRRSYRTRARASHLLGYVREISDRQLAEYNDFYEPGDLMGVAGLEARYENVLRGEKGYEYILVNAFGQIVGAYEDGRSDVLPKEGYDLYLSLDSQLQEFAEELMSNKRGAIVALDPQNGEILAIVSKPDYDPSTFSGVTPPQIWDSLNAHVEKPLFNRATSSRYPPGSTFKMVLAAAALQEKIIDTDWRITCRGSFRFGDEIFTCPTKTGHGSVNVIEAIEKSCNVFFYNLILKTGLEPWTKYGMLFGFGTPTGIDIGEETAGLLPSEAYFDKVYGKGKWTRGYLLSLAIGQGEVGVSPLQMACYAMALANGGKIYQPHAVRVIYNKKSARLDSLTYRSRTLPVSSEVWEILRRGLYLAVNGPGGTGRAARVPGIAVAGKTGTAQNPHGKDHAWFIGFAPYEDPRIVVSVLVENVGFGGVHAAPLAGKLIEKYLNGKIEERELVNQKLEAKTAASSPTMSGSHAQ